MIIGCVGGGQLLRMMCEAAQEMGAEHEFIAIDPTDPCPASPYLKEQIVANFTDKEAILALAKKVDVVTYELEHTDAVTLQAVSDAGTPVHPSPQILGIINDKFLQKSFLKDQGFPVPAFKDVATPEEAKNALATLGYPALLKARFGSYDGYGNALISDESDVDRAWCSLETKGALMIEEFVEFEKEVSVIAARNAVGECITYDTGENIHEDHVLRTTNVPARVAEEIQQQAQGIATRVVEALEGIGVFGIEFFVTKAGKILINEIAPRVHNSGHHTIDACATSQFEQHIRAITGKELGETTLTHAVVMSNLLGPEGLTGPYKLDMPEEVEQNKQVFLHMYGKADINPRRKMGHATLAAERSADMDTLLEQAKDISSKLKFVTT